MDSHSPPTSLHHALRLSTSALHKRLDSTLVIDAICSSEQELAGYLEDFHSALVLCWMAIDWDLLQDLGLEGTSSRKGRYHSLSADLGAWGRQVSPLVDSGNGSVARSIGVSYVLEGSMHGGRAILSKATEALGPIPPDRCRFLTGFGDDTQRRWSSYVHWLGTLPTDPDIRADVSGSASWAFEIFIDSINPRKPLESQRPT